MKRSRPPREVKFGYNPDIRSLNYRFVNAWNGESESNNSRALAGACAKGFSEHPQRPRMAPASVPPEVYLQCRNRCHGPGGQSGGIDTVIESPTPRKRRRYDPLIVPVK